MSRRSPYELVRTRRRPYVFGSEPTYTVLIFRDVLNIQLQISKSGCKTFRFWKRRGGEIFCSLVHSLVVTEVSRAPSSGAVGGCVTRLPPPATCAPVSAVSDESYHLDLPHNMSQRLRKRNCNSITVFCATPLFPVACQWPVWTSVPLARPFYRGCCHLCV